MWDLRRQFGEKVLSVWLEILSIADRNGGLVPGERDSIATEVAWQCHSSATRVRLMFPSFLALGWLKDDGGLKVAKYAEYHRARGTNQIPRGISIGSLPSEPSEPSLNKEKYIKKKKSFPEDFKIPDRIRELAAERGWPDPDTQLDAFRDHHVAKDSQFTDWVAAFRTWLRKAKQFQESQPRMAGRPTGQQLHDSIQGLELKK